MTPQLAQDRFAAALGHGRGTGPVGAISGYEPAALAALAELAAAWDAGRPQGLLDALRTHADDPDLRRPVRDRMRSVTVARLAALARERTWTLPAETFALLNLSAPTEGELGRYATLLADWTSELLFMRAPRTLAAAHELADEVASEAVCYLLAARTVTDPAGVLGAALTASAWQEWAQAFTSRKLAERWFAALPEAAWQKVWIRSLVAGNVYMCPKPIRVGDVGDARVRRDALHGELKALNADGEFAHLQP